MEKENEIFCENIYTSKPKGVRKVRIDLLSGFTSDKWLIIYNYSLIFK